MREQLFAPDLSAPALAHRASLFDNE